MRLPNGNGCFSALGAEPWTGACSVTSCVTLGKSVFLSESSLKGRHMSSLSPHPCKRWYNIYGCAGARTENTQRWGQGTPREHCRCGLGRLGAKTAGKWVMTVVVLQRRQRATQHWDPGSRPFCTEGSVMADKLLNPGQYLSLLDCKVGRTLPLLYVKLVLCRRGFIKHRFYWWWRC